MRHSRILTDPSRSREYALDASTFHRRVVESYDAPGDAEPWSRWDGYGWANVARHLYARRKDGQARARLYQLLNRAYLREKEARYRSPEAGAQDVLLAIEIASNAESYDLAQSLRFRLLYASLGWYTALVRQFKWDAGAHWRLRARAPLPQPHDQDQSTRPRAASIMGIALVDQGEYEAALEQFEQVLKHVELWSEGGGDIFVLAGTAPAMVRAGGLRRVREVLDRIEDADVRGNVLSRIALALAEPVQHEAALELIATAAAALSRCRAQDCAGVPQRRSAS